MRLCEWLCVYACVCVCLSVSMPVSLCLCVSLCVLYVVCVGVLHGAVLTLPVLLRVSMFCVPRRIGSGMATAGESNRGAC